MDSHSQHYKQVALAKFTDINQLARQTLAQAIEPHPHHNEDVLRVLQYLQRHVDEVIVCIHDLWAGHLFSMGYQYAAVPDHTQLQHNLLIPYDQMTPEQRLLENDLALGDLLSIAGVLLRSMPSRSSDAALHITDFGQLITQIDPDKTIAALIALAHDQQFVQAIAPQVHDYWRAAKRKLFATLTDSRLDRAYHLLTPSEQAVTLMNVQLDILAVALCLKEHTAQP